jgi:hypothetical protein
MPTPSSAAPPPPVDEQGRTGAGFTSPRQANTPVHSHVRVDQFRVDQWHGIGLQRVRTGAIVVGHGQSVLHRPVSANPAAGRVLDIFVPVGARSTSRRRVSLPDNALQVGSLGPLERAQRVGGSRRACGESSPAWPVEASWRGRPRRPGRRRSPATGRGTRVQRPLCPPARLRPRRCPKHGRAPSGLRQPRATVSGRAAGLAARPGALRLGQGDNW